MPDHTELTVRRVNDLWERLVAVKARDEEQARLGRLFNVLMVISLGICAALSSVLLLMNLLGMLSAKLSWIAAAFPLFFVPLSIYCMVNAKRGRIRPMVTLYVWTNLAGICASVWVFDGIRGPSWLMAAWNITVAGILLAPAYALRLTAGMLGYFLLLALLTWWNLYTPPLSFGVPGREFLSIAMVWIILVSTVGLLTNLNMRSLHEALENLRFEVAGRKRSEESLRQSEERFRNVFTNAADIIFTMSSEGAYISLNPAFGKLTGWPAEEWVGKSFAPLVPAADLPRAIDVLQKTLKGVEVALFELPVRKKSGGYFIGEFTVAPIRQGGSVSLLGICRDVTERKQLEEALSESERRFRAIFDSAPEGIFTASVNGAFTALNPAVARLLGWTPAEVAGTTYWAWIHPDDLELVNAAFRNLASGKPAEMVARVRAKSGGYRLVDCTATPLIEQDRVTGLLGFFRDITERRQMEQDIRKLNEELEEKIRGRTRQLVEAQEELVRTEKLSLLGHVADTVGHELRNPLGVMNNAVYFLQTVLADADKTTMEYLGIIRDEIANAERIVSDLLDAVRTKPPLAETVDVAELIGQSLRKCDVPPEVTVTLDVSRGLGPVYVDPAQMHQVFWNLISNAVEAMPDGGTLEIRAEEDPAAKTVTITIRDSGGGITPEHLSKVFQPLFTTKARRVGLGLVVVKNLTQANGGEVGVQSEVGKGTVFSITLPTGGQATESTKGRD